MLFESIGHPYSQVCGYVRGYSFSTPDGFGRGLNVHVPLSGNYVDGVSITYSTPPAHIWTYVAGVRENGQDPIDCPCNTGVWLTNFPSYIGSDYYCESGTTNVQQTWYTNDPLWDGKRCRGMEGPCCYYTGLPWFSKRIPTPTTARIEVRVCLDESTDNENLGIEQLALYVK